MEISREGAPFPYPFFYKFQLRKSFTTSQSNSGGNSNFQSAMPIVPKKIHPVVIIFFLSALCPRSMSFVPRGNIFDPFSIDIWNPLEAFTSIFDSALAVPRSNYPAEPAVFVSTRMDWKETPEAHIFKADLPGLKKEEVRVEVEGHVLQIRGERKREQEEKTDRWHSVERSCGKFVRRFRLPENVKVDQVKASMENGVLTVFVPKEDVKKHEVKSIEISGDEL